MVLIYITSKPTLKTFQSQTPNLQNCKEGNDSNLDHQSMAICYSKLQQNNLCPLLNKVLGQGQAVCVGSPTEGFVPDIASEWNQQLDDGKVDDTQEGRKLEADITRRELYLACLGLVSEIFQSLQLVHLQC